LHGDQRSFIEYHWHGLQLLTGNAFVLGGLVMFAGLLIIPLLVRTGNAAPVVSQDAGASREPAPGCAERAGDSADSARQATDSAQPAPHSRTSR
jgi:hypothetical protein